MSYDDLTSDNFIQRIKQMDIPQRNKIPAKKLIDLIMGLPDQDQATLEKVKTLEMTIQQIQTSVALVTDMATANKGEIAHLKVQNAKLEQRNAELEGEIETMKDEDEHNEPLGQEIEDLRNQVNDIEQYLRINNRSGL